MEALNRRRGLTDWPLWLGRSLAILVIVLVVFRPAQRWHGLYRAVAARLAMQRRALGPLCAKSGPENARRVASALARKHVTVQQSFDVFVDKCLFCTGPNLQPTKHQRSDHQTGYPRMRESTGQAGALLLKSRWPGHLHSRHIVLAGLDRPGRERSRPDRLAE